VKANPEITPEEHANQKQQPPWTIKGIALVFAAATLGATAAGLILNRGGEAQSSSPVTLGLAAVILFGIGLTLSLGLWRLKNWARSGVMLVLILLGLAFAVDMLFDVSAQIFAGESVVPVLEILKISLSGIGRVLLYGLIPGIILFLLMKFSWLFEETAEQREFLNRISRHILLASALSAIIVVALIILFTLIESTDAITEIGLENMLLGTIWRPGSIIGTEDAQFGLIPMIAGSILATFGAALLGVPLSIFTAILLAEVAPKAVREIVRPAVELLAGIPSVVYGLFGMVVLAPMIQRISLGFYHLSISVRIYRLGPDTWMVEYAICHLAG